MAEHFNGLTPEQDELLSVLAEECAEVIKEVMKIQRHGLFSANPDELRSPSNLALLHNELGHVRAAMILLARVEVLNLELLPVIANEKLKTIGKWLHHHEVKL